MKRLLVVCCLAAVGYLAIPLIVDAQSGMAVMTKGESGMPEYVGSTGGKVHVSNYSTAPDGGAVRQSADEHGRAYVRSVSADGGIPEVTLGDFGTATQPAAVDLSVNSSAAWGEVLCPSTSDVSVPTTALDGRREVLVQNLGPNPVYLCPGTPCTVATGVKLQADEEWRSFAFGSGITLYCIATVADQVSGAGLRYLEVK